MDEALWTRLCAVSQAAGESPNATVLRLLRDAVGVHSRWKRFRRYAARTDEDAEEFDAALRAQRVIAREPWE